MKAAILEAVDSPLIIGEVELGEVSRGQVLVKILVSGFCGSQIQEIAGNKGNAKFMPHMLGHEACGIVQQIGEGVTKVKKGDKVILHWRKGDGIEADFPTYTYKGKPMNSGKVTTFSEYSKVSENRVTPVPHDIDNDFCALLGCGLSTALGTLENDADLKAGESIMIIGVGGLGASFLKVAKTMGISPIIAVDIHADKQAVAEILGADFFINSREEEISTALTQRLNLKGVDVIIETSGSGKSISAALPLLAPSGRFIMVGQPKPGESIEITDAVNLFGGEGKSIQATQGGRFMPSRDIPRYIDMYRTGRLNIENLVTHRVKLDEINDAIALIRNGKTNRIMIDIWS